MLNLLSVSIAFKLRYSLHYKSIIVVHAWQQGV